MNLTPREQLICCGWTIGVLVLLVIGLLTSDIGGNPNIATLIGVATGLVSLVVGIIAIIYAFYSNGSLGDAASRLSGSSVEIKDAAERATVGIDKVLVEIKPLAEIAQRVNEMHSKLQVALVGGQSSSSATPAASQYAEQIVTYFINSSSWIGLLTLYSAIERHRHNKSFNAYAWTRIITDFSPDYAIGYLVCTSCTGLISYDSNSFLAEGNIRLTFVPPTLPEKISEAVMANLTRPEIPADLALLRRRQKELTDTYIAQ